MSTIFDRRRQVAEDLWVSVYLQHLSSGTSHEGSERAATAAVDAFIARFSVL